MPRWTISEMIPPPIQGVRYDLPSHLIPDGYSADVNNFIAKNGVLKVRPGYSSFSTGLTGIVEGIVYFENNSNIGILVAITQIGWWRYRQDTKTWSNITGAIALTGGYDNPARSVVFNQGGSQWVVGSNGKDTIKKWDSTTPAATYIELGGSSQYVLTLTPSAVAGRSSAEQTFTVAVGLTTDMVVSVYDLTGPTTGVGIGNARVSAYNTLAVTFVNENTVASTPSLSQYILQIFLNSSQAQVVLNQAMTGISVPANSTVEQIFTFSPGVTSVNQVVVNCASALPAGLAIVGCRPSPSLGNNIVSVTFMNVTGAAITMPTSYNVAVLTNSNNVSVVTQSIAPASVAANSMSEQTFTLNGVLQNPTQAFYVNKPTYQAGLGIVDVRSGGANKIIIAYMNSTAVSITPATEIYTFSIGINDNRPSAALDVESVLNRVVAVNVTQAGTNYPSGVLVSDSNNMDSWAAGLTLLTDTPDNIIGCKALNRTSFAIYKKNSQWVGIGQASGTAPFRYELIDTQPGPISKMAIISVSGGHYYIANDGSIYKFDGVLAREIGQPIRQYILNNIYYQYANRTHGVYRQQDNQIWWFFVNKNAASPYLPTSGISYNIVTNEFSVLNFGTGITASVSGDDIGGPVWSAGGVNDLSTYTWNTIGNTYPSWTSLGGTDKPLEYLGESYDVIGKLGLVSVDGIYGIDAYFTYPLRPVAGIDSNSRIDSIDVFTKKTLAGTAEVLFGKTDTLGQDPALSNPIQFDPSQDIRHQIFPESGSSGSIEARFITVKFHALSTASDIEFKGMVLFSNRKALT